MFEQNTEICDPPSLVCFAQVCNVVTVLIIDGLEKLTKRDDLAYIIVIHIFIYFKKGKC